MRIQNQSDFEDFRSVCALQDRYVTTEPFIGNLLFYKIYSNSQTGTTISVSKKLAITTELFADFLQTGKEKEWTKKMKVQKKIWREK